MTDSPPAYLSRSSLARELDCSESTVDEMVRRGVIPPPLKLSSGCVRWRWADVDMALQSLGQGSGDDQISRGIRNAAQASKGSRGAGDDPYSQGVKNAAEALKKKKP
jgi:predicted DNA-binding transcriptional regulator AlpA